MQFSECINLGWGLSGHNPLVSQEASVKLHVICKQSVLPLRDLNAFSPLLSLPLPLPPPPSHPPLSLLWPSCYDQDFQYYVE